METYDFRVRYAENTGEALVEIGMSDGKQASIASARIGFSQMIKKLTLYTPTLADLPRMLIWLKFPKCLLTAPRATLS